MIVQLTLNKNDLERIKEEKCGVLVYISQAIADNIVHSQNGEIKFNIYYKAENEESCEVEVDILENGNFTDSIFGVH